MREEGKGDEGRGGEDGRRGRGKWEEGGWKRGESLIVSLLSSFCLLTLPVPLVGLICWNRLYGLLMGLL